MRRQTARRSQPGRGVGGKPRLFDQFLFRDIESLRKKNKYSTTKQELVQQLVNDLRSDYKLYKRHNSQALIKRVSRVTTDSDCSDNDDETLTVKRRDGDVLKNSGGSSSSIASAAISEFSSEEYEMSYEEESNDAVYGEKLKPRLDLMKSMLRENYGRGESEVKELKIVENKGKRMGVVGGSDDLNGINNNNIDKNRGRDDSMFKDLGGMGVLLEELKKKVLVPFINPKLETCTGTKPTTGILLYGPPGCGKTKLARAIAIETKVPFYQISATELVSGVSGASEENIRELFSKASETAPSIIFIDEIDAIASKRENLQRQMERRIVTQLLTSMDELHKLVKPVDINKNLESSDFRRGHVLVIAATNRCDDLDPALRRPGRFDREFKLEVPDERARLEILSVVTSSLRVEGALDLLKIARSTPGFVGADLAALVSEAGCVATNRILDKRKAELSIRGEHCEDWWRQPFSDEEIEKISITMADFEEAIKLIQPSSRREGFSTIPNVKWDDVGGLDLLRQEFDRYIIRRIKYPEDFEGNEMTSNTGFLLYGPPGCGKTLIAKAVANEAGLNFIHIKGPELLNKYVGESESAVRKLFERARTCSPCIIFFDELDAFTTHRGNEGAWVVERTLTQLLLELDGGERRKGVYVIGATNRPENIDCALLRPGRFGKLLYVPLPSPDERVMILKALARGKSIYANVDLVAIGKNNDCSNFSGADLCALMDEAYQYALDDKHMSLSIKDDHSERARTSEGSSLTIKDEHFNRALRKIYPSVSDKQKQYRELLPDKVKAT